MFKSKEVNESQFLNGTLFSKLNDSYNGVPKVTSTPLNSQGSFKRSVKPLLTPKPSIHVLTPRSYSLSEDSPSNKSSRNNSFHSPGPLLTTLSYKDNVSLYEETKSSGLARRIAQYKEEADQIKQKHPPYEDKYDRPGLFPIVHLFKSDSPVVKPIRPRTVTIKLSSPDKNSPKLASPRRSKLLEDLNNSSLERNSLSNSFNHTVDPNTKSVLDALKEISRKRIHSSEEKDSPEDAGKRLRTQENGEVATSKRARADSPLITMGSISPPTKQITKKLKVYDEITASRSSSDMSYIVEDIQPKKRGKTKSTFTESPVTKRSNAGTQTKVATEIKSNVIIEPVVTEAAPVPIESPPKRPPIMKIFDDAPLDKMRKSRLAALLNTMTGRSIAEPIRSVSPSLKTSETELVKPPKTVPSEQNITITKPIKSILLTSIASHIPTTKHVHFDMSPSPQPSLSQTSITQTSMSIVSPIVSSSVSKPSPEAAKNTSSTTPAVSTNVSQETVKVMPTFSIEKTGSTLTSAGTTDQASVPTSSLTKTSTPDSSSLTMAAPNTSSLGGFKFDLKAPAIVSTSSVSSTVTTSAISTPTFNFTKPPAPVPTTSNSTFSFGKPDDAKQFELKTTKETPVISNSFNFGSSITTTAVSSPTFSFPAPTARVEASTPSTKPSFGFVSSTPVSSAPNSSIPTFGTPISTSAGPAFSFNNPKTTASAGSGFGGFGATTSTVTSVPSFSQPAGFNFAATTTAAPALGGSMSTTSIASGPTTTSSSLFGTSNSTNVFGGATATGAPAFGSKPTSSTFGNTPATAVPPFGGNPSSNMLGFGSTPATTASAFGSIPATTASAFGSTPATTASAFGSTPATTASAFGSIPATTASAFGSTHATPGTAFGTNISSSAFGGNNSTTAAFGTTPAPAYGSTAIPAFGSAPAASAPVFGTAVTSAPAFGSGGFGNASTPAFGTATSGFGVTTTTAAPSFGSNQTMFGAPADNKPAFGFGTTSQIPSLGASSNNDFGSSQTFGSSNTPANPPPAYGSTFGSTTTTASKANSTFTFNSSTTKPTAFGAPTTTSSNSFGTSGPFSSAGSFNNAGFGKSTAFGAAPVTNNSFGSSSAPSFGQAENKPAFSFGGSDNKASSVFGSTAGSSVFGKPATTQASSFGRPTSSFGAANTSAFGTQASSAGFNFGGNAPTTSSFAFGSSAPNNTVEPPKPTFNFTGGVSNPPAFGTANTTPAFGSSTAPPAFGSSNATPSFGGFGTTPAPSFGAVGSPAPSFGAAGSPAPGVFNIGAGSSTSAPPNRNRVQIRAKRRT